MPCTHFTFHLNVSGAEDSEDNKMFLFVMQDRYINTLEQTVMATGTEESPEAFGAQVLGSLTSPNTILVPTFSPSVCCSHTSFSLLLPICQALALLQSLCTSCPVWNILLPGIHAVYSLTLGLWSNITVAKISTF